MDERDLLSQLRIEPAQRDDLGGGNFHWPWVVGGLLAILLVSGGAWWWSSSRVVEVDTVVARAPTSGKSGAVLQATGYVTARLRATVSAQIIGTVTEVLIEEGDHVFKGQTLARLDDSSQRAYLNSARANERAAEAQVAQLRVQLTQAERDNERQVDLVARGLASRQFAEQAGTQVESLRAQLRSGEAQVNSATAQVAVAQVQYDYTVIRAPFDGVITQKAAQVGEIISPSAAGGGFTRTGVGTIVDMDSLEVDVDVNEAYIGRVEANMPAEAVLDAYPDWSIPAHVIAIVPAADRGKATVKVRVALEEKDSRIVPDMGVRVSFLEKSIGTAEDEVPKGVLVPATAITRRAGSTVVFTLENGVAIMHAVTPAAQTYGPQRLLPDGIRSGATVIDQPSERLVDGMRVVAATR